MDERLTYLTKDLVECEVYTVEGECLGRLRDVWPTGSNDIFVVGEGDKEVLIPALKSVVQLIDLENKVIKVQLPEGLRDKPGSS